MLEVITYPNPILREKAENVQTVDDSFMQFVHEMKEVMYEKDGVGLAATQVHVLKRVIVLDVGDGPMIVINPEIVQQSKEMDTLEEGCLSLPDIRINLARPTSIIVKGCNLQNQPVEYHAENLLARVFQHEIDHLNGILIIDHASSIQRSLLKSKLKKLEKMT